MGSGLLSGRTQSLLQLQDLGFHPLFHFFVVSNVLFEALASCLDLLNARLVLFELLKALLIQSLLSLELLCELLKLLLLEPAFFGMMMLCLLVSLLEVRMSGFERLVLLLDGVKGVLK